MLVESKMPTYNPNIPQPTNQISVSQDQILQNFQSLNPFILGVFELPPQASFPSATGNNILFAKTYSTTGLEEVFIQNAAGVNYPITAANPIQNAGWTFLPSGILLKWGNGTATGLTNVSLVYGPVFTTVFQTLLSPIASAGINTNTVIYSAGTTPTQLSVYGLQRTVVSTALATQFSYLVIGLGTGAT
jgi:hypothetical protein